MIRIIATLSLLAVVLTAGLPGTAQNAGGSLGTKEKVPAEPGTEVPADMKNAWTTFSYALFTKSRALEAEDNRDRLALLRRSLELFQDATQYGESLDLIYYHMADVYYYLRDFRRAIKYADRSIEENPSFDRPYLKKYDIYVNLRDYSEAVNTLEDYLEIDPGEVRFQFAVGRHYYNHLKDYEKAAESFRKVLEISYHQAVEDYYRESSSYYLGFIEYRKNNHDLAARYFRDVLDVNRDNMNAVFLLAKISMEQYNLDDAVKYARRYLEVKSDNSTMHAVAGRSLYLQDNAGALYHLRKASQLKTVEGILCQGLLEKQTGDDKKALKILQAVSQSRPRMLEPRVPLGSIYDSKGEKEKALDNITQAGILAFNYRLYTLARDQFLRAVELSPDEASLHYYLGRSYESLDQIPLAIAEYRQAYRLEKKDEILIHLGFLYGRQKDYERSDRYFNHVIERDADNHLAYFYMGMVSLWQEDLAGAEKEMRRAISIKNDNESYYFYLAVTLEKMKRYEETESVLKKAMELQDTSARVYNFLGYLYADRNYKLEESLQLINKALAMEPENGAYLDSLGWVYYRKGNYTQALRNLLRAERNMQDEGTADPVVYDHIGDTYLKLGNVDEALRYWKKALSYGDNSEIRDKVEKYEQGDNK
jgi:tetratricopeptide (TPR) repeat protein